MKNKKNNSPQTKSLNSLDEDVGSPSLVSNVRKRDKTADIFKSNKEIIEKIFVEEPYLDEKFPKGDKRRGEVLCLMGILNAKIQKVLAEKDKDILTARRCLNFKSIKCNNKDCINLSCPLNRRYDE